MRSGHTEAAVDLCWLTKLAPVGVISELMNDDGSVMKGSQVQDFAARHALKHVTIADIIGFRQAREKLVERVSSVTADSPIGPPQGYSYRTPFDPIHHVAYVYGGIGDGKNVLTRFYKPNIIRDMFSGQAQAKMNVVLQRFKENEGGVLIYVRDGAAGVPPEPLLPSSSSEEHRNRQWREIGVGAQILRDLGITSIRHLTSSTHYFRGLRDSASRSSETSNSHRFEEGHSTQLFRGRAVPLRPRGDTQCPRSQSETKRRQFKRTSVDGISVMREDHRRRLRTIQDSQW